MEILNFWDRKDLRYPQLKISGIQKDIKLIHRGYSDEVPYSIT